MCVPCASVCVCAWPGWLQVGGLLGSFVLSFVLEVLMVQHGLRGGPFETHKRRLVPRLIYLDFASHFCQVSALGLLRMCVVRCCQASGPAGLPCLYFASHACRTSRLGWMLCFAVL